MNANREQVKTALVLPGGGARGAFQAGVLKAVAELLPRGSANPFPVISGTSAGAVNSIVLASRAKNFRTAVAELEHVWGNFHCNQVYRTDHRKMLKTSLHWLFALVFGGWLVGMPCSMLDNSPLRRLLRDNVRFPRIRDAIEAGCLDAVAVTAAGYSTARSKTFFQAEPSQAGWERTRHVGVAAELGLDHLMASIAVPMVFPPQKIGNESFGDGAMGQATPLSPAVHLGADRILVVGIRDETGDEEPETAGEPPSFAQIAGYMLDTLFMDGLYSDLERITRINDMLDAVPESGNGTSGVPLRPIDTMVLVPSKDLRAIAERHRRQLPFTVRALLRGVGDTEPGGNRLLSFLLFEKSYTRELMELGYRDAMRVRDQLLDFVTGAEVPRLFAPSWVQKDLSIFD